MQKGTDAEKEAFSKQPDWVKHKDPTSLIKVSDPEKAAEEIRALKKENTRLATENKTLVVDAEKYKKRAVYVRKKFVELKDIYEKATGKKAKDVSVASNGSIDASRYRLKCTQLSGQLKGQNDKFEKKEQEMDKLKIKLGGLADKNSIWSMENAKLREAVQKLTHKLVKLEKDDTKRSQYEVIKSKIE